MWFEQKNQLHQPNLDRFMEKLYDYLPQQLVTFILVTLFSLLIGLSQRRISLKREGETEMHRDHTEHRLRRQLTKLRLTLRHESVGSKQD